MQKYWIKVNNIKCEATLASRFLSWYTFFYTYKGKRQSIMLPESFENDHFGKIDEPDLYPVFKDENELVQQLKSNVELTVDR